MTISPRYGAGLTVLVADANPGRAGALSASLRADPSLTVFTVLPGVTLVEAVRQHAPDVVLVDMARADRDALDSLNALSIPAIERPVVLFVDRDDCALMEAAIESGVCSYNVLETPPADVKPLLRAAIVLYARFLRTRDELSEARRSLTERRVIDKAKKLYMKSRNVGENEAYGWLRTHAMQTGQRIATVAARYLAAHSEEKDQS